MDNPLAVRGLESIRHLDREREQALLLHGPAFDQMFQGLACQAFHHDEQMPVVLSDLMDGADVGMVQGRSSRSEEHTSELQSLRHLVCRLLLEKKKEKH